MSNGVYGQAAMLAYQIRQIAFITDAPQMIKKLNTRYKAFDMTDNLKTHKTIHREVNDIKFAIFIRYSLKLLS